MVVTENITKKCSLGKKLIAHRAREVSRKRVSDNMKATVKADKRGTMMMVATIFGLFVVLESRVARVLNIAATVLIISLSRNRVQSTHLQSFRASSQKILEKFRT